MRMWTWLLLLMAAGILSFLGYYLNGVLALSRRLTRSVPILDASYAVQETAERQKRLAGQLQNHPGRSGHAATPEQAAEFDELKARHRQAVLAKDEAQRQFQEAVNGLKSPMYKPET